MSRFLLSLVCVGLAACGGSDQPTGPGSTDRLTIAQGDGQTVYLGARAAQPITAVVTDTGGRPLAGQEIRFAVVMGAATVDTASCLTDAAGQAWTDLVAGEVEGEIIVQATWAEGDERARAALAAARYPRVAPAEVLALRSGVTDTVGARGAVRAALASAGFSLTGRTGQALTLEGGDVTLGADAVDALALLELSGTRQTLGQFYTAFRTSRYSIMVARGTAFSTGLFVAALDSALATAQAFPDEPACNLVTIALSRDGVALHPGSVTAETQLSGVQSALLLLALADVANPSGAGARPVAWGREFFASTRAFPIGLLTAGGLIAAVARDVTASVAAPALIVGAMATAPGFGPYMTGSALRDARGALLPVSEATVAPVAAGTSVAVTQSNRAPSASVALPVTGSAYEQWEPVPLRGTGTDPEDGELSGSALVWTSDRDGPLGSGGTLGVTSLSVGTHTITLTVTDSRGLTASAAVHVTVEAPPVPVLALSPARIDVTGGRTETPVALTNAGTDTLYWVVREHESWLTVAAPQGDTRGGGEISGMGPVELTVTTSGTGFEEGVHDAAIQIQSNGGDVDLPVRMTVGHPAAAGDALTVELPGGETMDFVWVPPGTFTMGASDIARPVHEVTISKGFYLGRYEVTQGQWEAVLGTAPWADTSLGWVTAEAQRPAAYVSWYHVQELVAALNAADGAGTYRLPTEGEWEYACRAGTTTRWSSGDDEAQLREYAWYDGNAGSASRGGKEVGTRLPNPWGLYDMHGNVCEWCQDLYGMYSSDPQTDPSGSATGVNRVYRGGYFQSSPETLRSARRYNGAPTDVVYYVGARLVRTR